MDGCLLLVLVDLVVGRRRSRRLNTRDQRSGSVLLRARPQQKIAFDYRSNFLADQNTHEQVKTFRLAKCRR